jgi:hypothetical protein
MEGEIWPVTVHDEIWYGYVEWITLAQYSFQWLTLWALVNTVMNFRVPQMLKKFFTSQENISF